MSAPVAAASSRSREEVGVEVGLDDVLDPKSRCCGVEQVAVYVSLGIDNQGSTAGLVPDEIRRLRQAVQVVLREEHLTGSSSSGLMLSRPNHQVKWRVV
jgi:hypothetical protein